MSAGPDTFDRRLFLLVLVPAIIYGAYYSILIAVQDTGFSMTVEPESRLPREIQYQFLWVSAFAVSFAISLAVGISAGLTAWRNLLPRDRGIAVGLFLVGVAFAGIGELFATGERWYVFLGEGLYCSAFCRFGEEGVCADPTAGCALLGQLDLGLDLVKFAGAFALVLLTIAFIATLRGSGGDREDQVKRLGNAAKQQDALLYRAAAVYVMACITMIAWMYWPIPYLSPEEEAQYRELLLGAAVLQGVGFSLGVASIFLPASLMLHHRIARLAEGEVLGGQTKAEWLSDMGLVANPLDQLRRVMTMLMPTLVAFLPALERIWG